MGEYVPFQLKLDGDTAAYHQFQGYDGYMALAGFAWTLALVTHYAETGKIRQRGDFLGRHAVRGKAPAEGSVLVDLMVWIERSPEAVFGLAGAGAASSSFLYGLVERVISRNLGDNAAPQDPLIAALIKKRGGDVEHLVAITEAPIRQTHSVIDNGAEWIDIVGGHNIISRFNGETRDYVKLNVEDTAVQQESFSVSAFNANSGYGSVFDSALGRNVPFSMSRETLRRLGHVFSWGLDQYANRTGGLVFVTHSRILAMDGTPKRYIVSDARKVE